MNRRDLLKFLGIGGIAAKTVSKQEEAKWSKRQSPQTWHDGTYSIDLTAEEMQGNTTVLFLNGEDPEATIWRNGIPIRTTKVKK